MNQTLRIISIVLAMVLVLGLFGCTQAPAETTPDTTAPQQTTPSTTAPETTVPPTTAPAETEPPATEPEEPAIAPEDLAVTVNPVLQARRDAAEAYMREMATFLWSPDEDVIYALSSDIQTEEEAADFEGTVYRYKAGELYMGIPYTNSRSPAVNFYDYASEPDENGIHTITGLHSRCLGGGENGGSRVGNDCCSSIQQAWNYIGADIKPTFTVQMKSGSGYLNVGSYYRNEGAPQTINNCIENGEQVMFASYAFLQKADAVVKYNDRIGHAMMIVDVRTVFNGDNTIDPQRSYVTVLHQTNYYSGKDRSIYDPELGKEVHITYGVDDVFTFQYLFDNGYLPITCDVLIDPDAGFETFVHDTETEHTFETILKGAFSSNRLLSNATITITDKNGEVVTAAMRYSLSQRRTKNFKIDLAERFGSASYGVDWGDLNLKDLAPGTYHCTHVLRDAHGVEYTMRDFDFTI